MTSLPDKSTAGNFGALNKVNYQNLPPSDQTVDWDNTLLAPAICDIAANSLVAVRAVVSMTLAATTGALVLNNWQAVWQNATNTAPTLARTSTGIFTITFPTVVSDEYNASFGIFNSHMVNFTKGRGNLENPGGLSSIHVSASANVATVKCYNSSNALADFAGVVADIWISY